MTKHCHTYPGSQNFMPEKETYRWNWAELMRQDSILRWQCTTIQNQTSFGSSSATRFYNWETETKLRDVSGRFCLSIEPTQMQHYSLWLCSPTTRHVQRDCKKQRKCELIYSASQYVIAIYSVVTFACTAHERNMLPFKNAPTHLKQQLATRLKYFGTKLLSGCKKNSILTFFHQVMGHSKLKYSSSQIAIIHVYIYYFLCLCSLQQLLSTVPENNSKNNPLRATTLATLGKLWGS